MAIHAHFTVVDFIVFSLTLLASMGIGIFFSRAGGAQQSNNEYLMAGRSMSSIPVAISVLASFVSSIAILGNPAEVYTYGFQYWIQSFTNFISVPMMALVFLPVYYNLRLTSSYEVGRRDISLSHSFKIHLNSIEITDHRSRKSQKLLCNKGQVNSFFVVKLGYKKIRCREILRREPSIITTY